MVRRPEWHSCAAVDIQVEPNYALSRPPSLARAPGRRRISYAHPRDNRLLASLPVNSYERLLPYLEQVSMVGGTPIHACRNGRQNVYFPTDCIVSVLQLIRDGRSIEVAVIGREGLVGASALLGGYDSFSHAFVQAKGTAFRLNTDVLRKSFNRCEATQAIVLRYTQSLYIQTAQTAVCNRHHSVMQQFIRRLLLGIDRSSSPTLVMTHESMAAKLGVRRESITEAAGKLHSLGLISYRRGRITVVDREKLESLCCECYEAERRESARLMPS
jgi:CRP-like cAMP-binding protein